MKKLVVLLMIASFAAVGCTGTFKLTNEVYKFHRSQEKWVDEILFVAFVIVPVYGVATLADGIIFNSIEFWTGQNPIASTGDGENHLATKFDEQTGNIEVTSLAEPEKSAVVSRTDTGVIVKNQQGEVLFTSVEDSLGGVTVFDANNDVIQYYRPEQIEKERLSLSQR